MRPKRASLDPMPDEQPKKEPIALIKPKAWEALSPDEKKAFVQKFNDEVNARRKERGLPPLPKRPA